MIDFLLINIIILTNITGNNIPFKTCDHKLIPIRGAFGIKIIPIEIINIAGD